MAPTRRLAAILVADVAGYSRPMGADEEGTLERLKAHRRRLIDPKVAERNGRIVKTTGDGLLVEFASVVDAVRCAAEVQCGMLDREPAPSTTRSRHQGTRRSSEAAPRQLFKHLPGKICGIFWAANNLLFIRIYFFAGLRKAGMPEE